jgi:integrase/recombinase XerC
MPTIRPHQRIDEDLIRSWTKYVDVKQNSATTYKRAIKQFIIFLNIFNIQYPQRDNIIAFRDWLESKGLKATTILNYLNAVKLFFQWTEQMGLYPDVAKHVKAPKVSRNHKKDYFTSTQSKDLLDFIDTSTLKGKRDYAIIFLMITCGLRTEEVINANVKDIYLHGDNTILYILGKARTEKADYVKITGPVERAIRDYLNERDEYAPTDPLFVSTSNNNHNGRITTRAIRDIVKSVYKKIGLADNRHSAHSLRHTAITLALLAGNDITEVKQFARHQNIDTTMIYNHALEFEKNHCSEDVTNMVFQNNSDS